MSDKNAEDRYLVEGLPEAYRRSRRAWEEEEPAPEAIAIAFLGYLLELQQAAEGVFAAAAARAADPELARGLGELSRIQGDFARRLAQGMQDLGGTPPRPEESRAELTVDVAAVRRTDDDDELLEAVRVDVEEVADAYHAPIPPALPDAEARLVLDLKMRQERLRREWLGG